MTFQSRRDSARGSGGKGHPQHLTPSGTGALVNELVLLPSVLPGSEPSPQAPSSEAVSPSALVRNPGLLKSAGGYSLC